MRDDLRPDGSPERARPTGDAGRAPSDREVPIDGTRGTAIPDDVHAWLDGDATDAGLRRDGRQHDVEFWNAFGEELTARRRVRSPAGLATRIMAAILMELPA